VCKCLAEIKEIFGRPTHSHQHNIELNVTEDHLCGLVVRVPGYRSRDRGSTPGATRFSEK
jgi:hypothetical protein